MGTRGPWPIHGSTIDFNFSRPIERHPEEWGWGAVKIKKIKRTSLCGGHSVCQIWGEKHIKLNPVRTLRGQEGSEVCNDWSHTLMQKTISSYAASEGHFRKCLMAEMFFKPPFWASLFWVSIIVTPDLVLESILAPPLHRWVLCSFWNFNIYPLNKKLLNPSLLVSTFWFPQPDLVKIHLGFLRWANIHHVCL